MSSTSRIERNQFMWHIIVALMAVLAVQGCSHLGYRPTAEEETVENANEEGALQLPELPDVDMTTTQMGATTGAILGAGLGTIIGSTSGNAGEGLVIGSLAGAAAGGAIGHGLESQERVLLNQREAVTRQEETLESQRREIDSLREQLDEQISLRNKPSKRGVAASPFRESSSSVKSKKKNDVGSIEEVKIAPKTRELESVKDDGFLPKTKPLSNSETKTAQSTQAIGGLVEEDLSEAPLDFPRREDETVKSNAKNAETAGGNFDLPPARQVAKKGDDAGAAVVFSEDDFDTSDNSGLSPEKKGQEKQSKAVAATTQPPSRSRLAKKFEVDPNEKSEGSTSKSTGSSVKVVPTKTEKVSADKAGAKNKTPSVAALPSKTEVKVDTGKQVTQKGVESSSKTSTEGTRPKGEDVAKGESANVVSSTETAKEKEGAKGGAGAKTASLTPAEKSQTAISPTSSHVAKDDPSCIKADDDARRASGAKSAVDKLFYYRKALRLCPSESKYHYEMGKVYSSIGRNEEAIYEFRQSLDLNPNHNEARSELGKLGAD